MQADSVDTLLLEDDIRLVLATNDVLTRLWRLTIRKLPITLSIWDGMLLDYIDRCRETMDDKRANNLKGNLGKSLAKDEMSWKYFCRGITIPGFERVRLQVELMFEEGSVTSITTIPPVYGDLVEVDDKGNRIETDTTGFILGYLYKDLYAKCAPLFPNYPKIFREYCEKCHEVKGEDIGSIKSNLPRALAEDKMTWQVFYRGISVYPAKAVKLTLFMKEHGTEVERVVELTVRN